MPSIEDDQDGKYAAGRLVDRFYVSKRFRPRGDRGEPMDERYSRFAYQVFDTENDVRFESDAGWDLVIRETPSRQQLKALFFEDTRSVRHLAFQRFNATGKQLRRESFVLTGPEVDALASYLALVRSHALDLDSADDGVRLLPAGIDELLSNEIQRQEVFGRYRDVFVELLESDVDSPEIVALARRREQLRLFDALLTDADYFEERRSQIGPGETTAGPEAVWQDFFEQNHWIFGTGLAPQFLHSWDPGRLEQAVAGASVFGSGKRPDALMRTAGALSALTFVEVKSHGADLIQRTEYRPDTWRPGADVVGGVAQCQATVDSVVQRAGGDLERDDADGFRTGERTVVCRPRSVLVVGSLQEFIRDGQPSISRFESFERFRRSLRDPEIVTFDELYERARLAFDLSADTDGGPS